MSEKNTNFYMRKIRKIRLYVEFSKQNKVQLNQEQSHYLLNVMRCKEDEKIYIFNQNMGEWIASIEINKKSLFVKPINLYREPQPRNTKRIVLCFGPTKKYGEFVVEKATEMAIDAIMPIMSDRSVVNKINEDKYQKTIIEAAEQSGAILLPHLFCMTKISHIQEQIACQYEGFNHMYIVLHTATAQLETISIDQLEVPENTVLSIIIGPEGGFSDSDIDIIKKTITSNLVFIRLGASVMRAETASVAAIALCNAITGKYS
jgi:16S rRNA (uracil1498-N3)-methyltransferase